MNRINFNDFITQVASQMAKEVDKRYINQKFINVGVIQLENTYYYNPNSILDHHLWMVKEPYSN
jgi:hypothetical protein